jgi:hypothetical protein
MSESKINSFIHFATVKCLKIINDRIRSGIIPFKIDKVPGGDETMQKILTTLRDMFTSSIFILTPDVFNSGENASVIVFVLSDPDKQTVGDELTRLVHKKRKVSHAAS